MNRPLSICVCTRFHPSVGGIETLTEILARFWAAWGHDVTIICDVARGAGASRDFPFNVLHRPSPLQMLAAVKKCDLFVHMNVSLRAVWPLVCTRRPFVAVHHSSYGSEAPRGLRDRLKVGMARRWAHNISVSMAVQCSIGVAGVTIHNCYDETRFKFAGMRRDRDLVFVGRLVSEKGADLLVRVLSTLRSRGNSATLSIVGDGPERLPLERLVKEQGLCSQVEFLGLKSQSELPEILNRHEIMVVPTLSNEPFGIVALEGAACGCVVVGSSGGGLPEAIGPSGVTFRNGDDRQLAEILEEMLRNRLELGRYRDASVAHLAEHKSDVVAAKYIDYFYRVINEAGKDNRCAS